MRSDYYYFFFSFFAIRRSTLRKGGVCAYGLLNVDGCIRIARGREWWWWDGGGGGWGSGGKGAQHERSRQENEARGGWVRWVRKQTQFGVAVESRSFANCCI